MKSRGMDQGPGLLPSSPELTSPRTCPTLADLPVDDTYDRSPEPQGHHKDAVVILV